MSFLLGFIPLMANLYAFIWQFWWLIGLSFGLIGLGASQLHESRRKAIGIILFGWLIWLFGMAIIMYTAGEVGMANLRETSANFVTINKSI
jgi:NADH:ubiquinone oxidoreductase subunit 5 (subunit L)/multisubunit Na+/H+ antiporter MnhA subunit